VLVELDAASADAATACATAVERAPADLGALGLRAITLGHHGELDRALADLNRVIAADGNVGWRVARAWVHQQRGDQEAARADRETACRLGAREACSAPPP
jgi:Flp pilus assembly protein TadD